ncbi:hypothetical protein P9B03_03710 [Metasolibacillus meyeri]|uniref:S1 motif domain-containing protein n=1 Tax=Metasolibacillus meyeri TaxID=1071052 RepID=A0AAW9NT11_9BACL|nr:hypothetical protein [Metasolibacillus meyeri]MEC1177580.1 hypothetical protein [Metasolibacillus meyeri]
MFKKAATILVTFAVLFTLILPNQQVEASTTYTFVSATYDETVAKDGTVTKVLNGVTLQNSRGNRSTFNMDNSAKLYINNTMTTIDGFKSGMEVTVKVNLRRVTEMRGTSAVEQGTIAPNSRQQYGIVTKIDPNGLFVTIKMDGAKEQDYYVNKNTRFIKGSSTHDLSALYEGDRVKVKFSAPSTSIISEMEIIVTGVQVENIYKAKLQTVNTSANTFVVQNAHAFKNWLFGTSEKAAMNNFSFDNNTSIYVGNEKITKNQLRNYQNSELYYVTTKQFGKEVVKKVVVLQNNERTYYEPLTAVNTSLNFLQLGYAGQLYMHEGSILIRNGRLVEPSTLAAYGSAYVVTDGATSSRFAHVVNITNDSMTSPNLAQQGLYYGQLEFVDMDNYLVELDGLEKIENNYWVSQPATTFAYSNSSHMVSNVRNGVISVVPNMDLIEHEGAYGYFYVKDGHIQALHVLTSSQKKSELVLTGRIQDFRTLTSNGQETRLMNVKDVSQWLNGEWIDNGSLTNVMLDRATIIKNGRAIKASELKASDRVVLFTNAQFDAHIILVNE